LRWLSYLLGEDNRSAKTISDLDNLTDTETSDKSELLPGAKNKDKIKDWKKLALCTIIHYFTYPGLGVRETLFVFQPSTLPQAMMTIPPYCRQAPACTIRYIKQRINKLPV